MKISVAIPSYNYEKYLETCLNSILKQDHFDYEVLICDGGSSDGSVDMIEEFVKKDHRFKLISRSDLGQSDAIDKAFRHATGDVLCYLNADDYYISETAFSLAISAFQSNPGIGVVSFRSVYVDETGKVMRPVNSRRHPLDKLSWIKYRGQIVQPSAFWRRRVYDTCPFHTKWHYCFDSAFFYEAYQSFDFLERPEIVAAYRLHGLNKSVGISPVRIYELAEFEQDKFGPTSIRAKYLRSIARLADRLTSNSCLSSVSKRMLYVMVNSMSFLSFHRLPNI